MSKDYYSELLREFQEAWARLDAAPYSLDTFHLNWYSISGFSDQQPPWDRKAQVIIGAIHLPFAVDSERGAAGVVVVPSDEKREPARRALLPLAAKGGAGLPHVIRDRLSVFCPWEESRAASWWYALLWWLWGDWPRTSDGRFRNHLVLLRPFLLSVAAIEFCKLNTDTPGFPEDGELEESRRKLTRRGRPVATEAERKRDRTWYDKWCSRAYKTYADLAANVSTSSEPVAEQDIRRAIERHTKRLNRAGQKPVKYT